MSEKEASLTIEEKVAVVDTWIDSLSSYDEDGNVEIRELDQQVLKEVFQEFGADFKETGATQSLSKYSNKGRRQGMDSVWGKATIDSYNYWAAQWADAYEDETGNRLPALKPSGIKTSGLRHFLGELTAFAFGTISFEYQRYMGARLKNGWLWAQGRKADRVRVKLPTAEKPKLLASIPPGFPKDAWEEIKTWS